MAAYPCQNVTVTGELCEGARSSGVHSRHHKDFHEYWKDKPVGLQPMSEGMRNYRRSAAHREAMELSLNDRTCWPKAHGAPGECFGEITASHILSAGANGGLPVADTFPAPPACQRHNAGNEQEPEIRDWAEVTMFTFNGRQYPFKITREWLQAEREGVRL